MPKHFDPMTNIQRYQHFVEKWNELKDSQKAGITGSSIRVKANDVWSLLTAEEMQQLGTQMCPEHIFAGYQK
jgi:hypothetical protein